MDDSHGTRAVRPSFLCDAMLGSLARWLRFFGYDAEYMAPGTSDSRLKDVARAGGRWLVTRNGALAASGPRSLLLRADEIEDQLVEVFSRLGLSPEATLGCSRCGECNGPLEPASADDVVGEVPPHVAATQDRFRRCTRCAKIYWPGSHSSRIVALMERVVGELS